MDRVKAEDAEARDLRLKIEDRDLQLEGYIRLGKQLLEQEEREQRDGQGTADRIRCDRRTLRRLRREILTDRGHLTTGGVQCTLNAAGKLLRTDDGSVDETEKKNVGGETPICAELKVPPWERRSS